MNLGARIRPGGRERAPYLCVITNIIDLVSAVFPVVRMDVFYRPSPDISPGRLLKRRVPVKYPG